VIPPGAVSTATTVRLTRDRQTPPTAVAGLASAGDPVHITLDEGTLTGHATIVLPVERPSALPADQPVRAFPAYHDQLSHSWTAVDGRMDRAAHTLTLTTAHFSWWNPFTWDYGKIRDSVKHALADMAGAPSGVPPACAHPPPKSTVSVRITGSELVDHCLDTDGGQTVLRLRGTTDYPLLVSWAGQAQPSRRSEYGLDITSAYRWLAARSDINVRDATLMTPGGDVALAVSPSSNGSVIVSATYDPQTQLVGIIDSTVRVVTAVRSALKIDTNTEKIVQTVLDDGCLAKNVDNLDDDPAGTMTTLTADCAKDTIATLSRGSTGLLRFIGRIPSVVGALVGTVGHAANTVISEFYAGRDILSDATEETFTVSVQTSPGTAPPNPPSGSGKSVWPVDDNEGPPALWAWFGASFVVPDWVSCDDGNAWCIAGEGATVHIIRLDGLVDAGAVPTAVRHPVKALAAKGLPEALARELVRPG
jgi:hypothetical protein